VSEGPGTVCIVGLGLMGGSLALALRMAERAPDLIVAVSRRADVLEAARSAGAIDLATRNLRAGVADADVIVLATPVRTILRLLPEVGRSARSRALVMDLGSSKTQICEAMESLPAGLQPVGGHPMCGKEMAGFAAADGALFRERAFALCPLARTAPEALDAATALARSVGARPLVVDPVLHDRAVAGISHLPYVAAAALVNCVTSSGDPLAWSLASSGFRDTSRLAASDVDMMLDILLTNREAVVDWLERYAGQLDVLRSALGSGDEAGLRELLVAAQRGRAGLST
jgi:prephenate dehydrogenase